jgi:hypothetical protein
MNKDLTVAAATHIDSCMAKYNVLTHRCVPSPGTKALPATYTGGTWLEPDLGPRITAAGYKWSYIAENAAWNSVGNRSGIEAMQKGMYGEVPPNDDHRLNILSTNYTNVGVSVVFDYIHNKVWLNADFGKPL